MRFAWTGPVVVVALLVSTSAPAGGQAAAVPRMPDGKPSLQGIWQTLTTASYDVQDHQAHLGTFPGQGIVEGNDIPYQSWALAKKRETSKSERPPIRKRRGTCRGCHASCTCRFRFKSPRRPIT